MILTYLHPGDLSLFQWLLILVILGLVACGVVAGTLALAAYILKRVTGRADRGIG